MTVAQQLADGGVVLRETVPSSDVVRSRFGDVDGLRAFAIVAIVAYQTVRFVGLPARVPPAVAQLFSDASQGFTLFLMLSAFSLAYPILAARRTDGATYLDIGRYAVKRLLRIYPAFLAVLAIAFAIHPLAAALRWTAVANVVPAIPVSSVLRSAVFSDGGFGGFSDGAGNDGFTALALVARGFILLPIALFGWLRAPRLTLAAALLAAAIDVLTPAHAFTLSAVLPLVLGIVAADMRVQHHRLQRFGLPLALGAAVVAFFLGPSLETMAGTIAAPDALRVDPFWSMALFGLVAAVGFSGRLETVLGFPPLRLLGTAAYGISLVAMPVAALATRTLPERLSFGALAASTVAEEVGAGIVVWLAVDRWFSGDGLRRRAADGPGAWLDGILAKWNASRIVFAAPAPAPADEPEPVELRVAPPPAAFYAPPPRPATDIPVFSTRTGSADELAAEILQTKARLGERSAAVLDPEPRPVAPNADPYAKPGFYRRPPQPVSPPGGRLSTTAVAPPAAVSPIAVSPIAAQAVAAPQVGESAVAASQIASPVLADNAGTMSAARGPSMESPSAAEARSVGITSIDRAVSSTATTAAEHENVVTSEATLVARIADPIAEVNPVEPPSTVAIGKVESALATSADFVREPGARTPHAATPAEVRQPAVERAPEAPPVAAAPDRRDRAVEPAVDHRSGSTPSDAWFRVAPPVSHSVGEPPVTPPSVTPSSIPPQSAAPPHSAATLSAAPPSVAPPSVAPPSVAPPSVAPTSVAPTSVAPLSAAKPPVSVSSVAMPSVEPAPLATSDDAFDVLEASGKSLAATDDAEPDAEGPFSSEPFQSSYDGESPLEMLRAAYPPIDEPPTTAPEPHPPAPAFERSRGTMAFRLSYESPVLPDDPPVPAPTARSSDREPPHPSFSAVEATSNGRSANELRSAANVLPIDRTPNSATAPRKSSPDGYDRATSSTRPSLGSPPSVVPEPADARIFAVPEASATPSQAEPPFAEPFVAEPLAMAPLAMAPLSTAPPATAPLSTAPPATAPLSTALPAPDALLADPLLADPLLADPLATTPILAEPLLAEPLVAEALVAEALPAAPLPAASLPAASFPANRFAAASLPANPLAAAPLPADPIAAEPLPASAPHVAPREAAPLPVLVLSEAAAQPNRPGGDPLRPVVKASLLVRVFKHARAKFKPVVSTTTAAPADVSAPPPIPSAVPVVAAARGTSATATPAFPPEAPATKPATASNSNAIASATSFAHATPPPGRQSIRMRIGPTRVSHPDGEHG